MASIRVVKGSPGHTLADAFGFGGPPWSKPSKKRTGVRKRPARAKKRRLTFLRLLAHLRMGPTRAPGQRKEKRMRRANLAMAAFPGATP